MADNKVSDEPIQVDAEDGDVVLTASDAIHLRLTPPAAEESSERLLEGAMKARGQRYFNDERDP